MDGVDRLSLCDIELELLAMVDCETIELLAMVDNGDERGSGDGDCGWWRR